MDTRDPENSVRHETWELCEEVVFIVTKHQQKYHPTQPLYNLDSSRSGRSW